MDRRDRRAYVGMGVAWAVFLVVTLLVVGCQDPVSVVQKPTEVVEVPVPYPVPGETVEVPVADTGAINGILRALEEVVAENRRQRRALEEIVRLACARGEAFAGDLCGIARGGLGL